MNRYMYISLACMSIAATLHGASALSRFARQGTILTRAAVPKQPGGVPGAQLTRTPTPNPIIPQRFVHMPGAKPQPAPGELRYPSFLTSNTTLYKQPNTGLWGNIRNFFGRQNAPTFNPNQPGARQFGTSATALTASNVASGGAAGAKLAKLLGAGLGLAVAKKGADELTEGAHAPTIAPASWLERFSSWSNQPSGVATRSNEGESRIQEFESLPTQAFGSLEEPTVERAVEATIKEPEQPLQLAEVAPEEVQEATPQEPQELATEELPNIIVSKSDIPLTEEEKAILALPAEDIWNKTIWENLSNDAFVRNVIETLEQHDPAKAAQVATAIASYFISKTPDPLRPNLSMWSPSDIKEKADYELRMAALSGIVSSYIPTVSVITDFLLNHAPEVVEFHRAPRFLEVLYNNTKNSKDERQAAIAENIKNGIIRNADLLKNLGKNEADGFWRRILHESGQSILNLLTPEERAQANI